MFFLTLILSLCISSSLNNMDSVYEAIFELIWSVFMIVLPSSLFLNWRGPPHSITSSFYNVSGDSTKSMSYSTKIVLWRGFVYTYGSLLSLQFICLYKPPQCFWQLQGTRKANRIFVLHKPLEHKCGKDYYFKLMRNLVNQGCWRSYFFFFFLLHSYYFMILIKVNLGL